MILGIDIETRSAVDLIKTNVYKYSEDKSFKILLFGYAINDDPVTVIDLTRQELPQNIRDMLTDPGVIKQAYNANFERVCLSRYLGIDGFLDPCQWRCTMIHAATLGLPRSLKDVGAAVGLRSDKAKLKIGEELIRYFCKPARPTKANGGRTWNEPFHDPEKWQAFIEYNRRDVEVERTLRHMFDKHPVSKDEWCYWWMDQEINDRGVMIDENLAKQAISMFREHAEDLTDEATKITNLSNVNSVSQLKGWLGVEGSLDKQAIKDLRASGVSESADRVLAIRQELGKTSVSKYDAMLNGQCADHRVRGLFQYYGAATGRWAGRQVQVQNLPQNHLPDLDLARNIVMEGDRSCLQALYGNVPAVLSELIRTAFVAKPGHVFVVADYSQIEARCLSWYSGENWRMETFRRGEDIYCASASKMFGVPVVKNGVNGHLRQKGKVAELALGYGGASGAMVRMGATQMGIPEEELPGIVDAWRSANPRIVDLWRDVDRMARRTVEYGTREDLFHGLASMLTHNLLHIRLASGRWLRYYQPTIDVNNKGFDSIMYSTTQMGTWTRVDTYGAKLVENIVQATCADVIKEAMFRVSQRYPNIVMHVHDEMIVEVPEEEAEEALAYILGIMKEPIRWAPSLWLKGEGYITKYYRKD